MLPGLALIELSRSMYVHTLSTQPIHVMFILRGAIARGDVMSHFVRILLINS